MRVDWKARGLGIVLVLLAFPALILVAAPLGVMLAFGLAVVGLFLVIVVAERAVPVDGVQALLDGHVEQSRTWVQGLGLQGPPVYVHDQGNVGEPRLFLPASENEKPVPILDRETTTYPGAGETKIGLAVHPPGLSLVQAHELATGSSMTGATLPEVEAFLKGLFTTHDMARGLRITQEPSGLRVRLASAGLRPPCLGTPTDPACPRVGCGLCQAVGCSLAQGLGRPVTVTRAEIEAPWVTLHLVPEGGLGSVRPDRASEAEEDREQPRNVAEESGPVEPASSSQEGGDP